MKKSVNANKKLMPKDFAHELWETTWTYVKTVVDTVREPFLILDKNFKVVVANEAFYQFFKVARASTEKQDVFKIGDGQWNIPSLKRLLEEILPRDTFFKDFEVDHDFQIIGRKIMRLNARQIYGTKDKSLPQLILLAMEDVTAKELAEKKLEEYTTRLEEAIDKRTIQLENRIKELEKLTKIIAERESMVLKLRAEIDTLKKTGC